jgi:hypothetical protein
MKKLILVAVVFTAATLIPVLAIQAKGRGDGPTIYVISQDLFYDSIITAEKVPPKGPFQQLMLTSVEGANLETEFGPGDKGHVGGRWWVDVNENGEMDEEDNYFVCPLLGPGRAAP